MILIKKFIVAIELFIFNRNNCRYILLCTDNKVKNIQTSLSICILCAISYALIKKIQQTFQLSSKFAASCS
uniref:Uncharacterized 8.0 kDa protein in ndhF-psbD intergenic region n=1 Tax=Mesostigma viride TaxID=41882 RepID=YCX5_MESVI|nr:hypothetical protein MeviCp086 [Mesostigma viride]Q9MUM7.1 RecName: Full=Uncharacterized 8.0 kDa protein in ndhF-psbD intergenic region [Mesostigma viride]AAF43892.1 unknown [Mesostigma viride]WKT08278.1 hypothetical protein [Mesostigma viride]